MKATQTIQFARLVMFDEKTQKTVFISTAYQTIGVHVMQFARKIVEDAGKKPTTLMCEKCQPTEQELGDLWICTTGKFSVRIRCLWGS